MRQAWRWFGPEDPVSLREIRQAGATDVVSALHHLPCGALWTEAEIARHRDRIEAGGSTGLSWTVVESLPVHEAIKTHAPGWRDHLAVYLESLANLGRQGLATVCYNFMPVLDWTRTDLAMELPDGSRVLACDMAGLAAFDLFILGRPGADADYPAVELEAAMNRYRSLDGPGRERLTRSILMGLPGTVDDLTVEGFRAQLASYRDIDAEALRAHFHGFLEAVLPVCERHGMRMAIHPDDPPRPIFGLPRIMSTAADVEALLARFPSPACGLTLCTGSFGSRADNAPAAMFERFGPRVHFAHLRNVAFVQDGTRSFHEAGHLSGAVDMPRTMAALIREEERRRAAGVADWQIPVRPDHGRLLDCDRDRGCYAGYSYVGRLMGLAELRGLEAGLRHAQGLALG
jgi:mannonate dehydratase